MKLVYSRYRQEQRRKYILLFGVLLFIGYLVYAAYALTNWFKPVKVPCKCVGYTVINRKYVQWCDGSIREYDWNKAMRPDIKWKKKRK